MIFSASRFRSREFLVNTARSMVTPTPQINTGAADHSQSRRVPFTCQNSKRPNGINLGTNRRSTKHKQLQRSWVKNFSLKSSFSAIQVLLERQSIIATLSSQVKTE